MEIRETESFNKSLEKLSKDARRLYATQKNRFLKDSKDPRLHTKKVINLPGVFSFRITRRYRLLFYLQNSDTAIFFEIGHRKDIYR